MLLSECSNERQTFLGAGSVANTAYCVERITSDFDESHNNITEILSFCQFKKCQKFGKLFEFCRFRLKPLERCGIQK
jgi:hypothetical protein